MIPTKAFNSNQGMGQDKKKKRCYATWCIKHTYSKWNGCSYYENIKQCDAAIVFEDEGEMAGIKKQKRKET